MEPREPQVVVLLHHAVRRDQRAGHHLEQRRLAGAVGADERHARLEVDADFNVLVDHNVRVRVVERNILTDDTPHETTTVNKMPR